VPFIERHLPGVVLCVATSRGAFGGENVEKQDNSGIDYEDWCLQNGFELVDLDAKAEADDGELN
jgi:hypothetical protein